MARSTLFLVGFGALAIAGFVGYCQFIGVEEMSGLIFTFGSTVLAACAGGLIMLASVFEAQP